MQYVLSGDATGVEFHLRDPPPSPPDHIVSHYSAEGLTVLHYATRKESTDVLKKLVEFCKGENYISSVRQSLPEPLIPIHPCMPFSCPLDVCAFPCLCYQPGPSITSVPIADNPASFNSYLDEIYIQLEVFF